MESRPAVADEIWELIKETRKDMKEFRADTKEFRAEMREFKSRMEELRASQRETDKQIAATNKQIAATSEQQKETDKQLRKTDSRFNTQWGRLVESLVEGSLAELLQDRDIEVHQTSPNIKVSFTRDDGELQRKEFDIVVVNAAEAVAVEVKTLLTPDKVKYFLSAMEDFKRYFPDYRRKAVYGAVAYLRSEAQAALFAERQGLFVIRATGDSASIVNSEGFRPRAFPTGS